MNLSEMREMLAARGIQLTKSLGQNFLHDANQLRRIVDAAELNRSDKVLEIGPGLGPLTELLVEKAGEVLAIEKDARLVELLRERFRPLSTNFQLERGRPRPREGTPRERSDKGVRAPLQGRNARLVRGILTPSLSPSDGERDAKPGKGASGAGLRLLHADALELLRREQRDWSAWKLVANLPYSVASPILVELAQTPQRPERMVVTLQLEVARRLLAQAGDEDYGLLTLLVQLDYAPRDWFKIPATCFFPAPEVDSACITLVRRSEPLLADEHRAAFVKIVKHAFSQRRKMMLKLLKADWPLEKLERAFAELSVPPQTRAEKVSLELFARLACLLDARAGQP